MSQFMFVCVYFLHLCIYFFQCTTIFVFGEMKIHRTLLASYAQISVEIFDRLLSLTDCGLGPDTDNLSFESIYVVVNNTVEEQPNCVDVPLNTNESTAERIYTDRCQAGTFLGQDSGSLFLSIKLYCYLVKMPFSFFCTGPPVIASLGLGVLIVSVYSTIFLNRCRPL